MIVGIDLHNIRDGGGVNYIRNLLAAANPDRDGFRAVHLFGSPRVLAMFPNPSWVVKHAFDALERKLPHRLRFVATKLPKLLREAGCDILYAPGGVAFGNFRPYVTISRNMMPFRPEFWAMYPRFSAERARLHLLRRVNGMSFARADGMIYLSETARHVVSGFLSRTPKAVEVVPHGVDHERFKPVGRRETLPGEGATLIYPSRLEPYKHQVEVVEAFANLRQRHPGIHLQLCGPANPPYLARFKAAAGRVDPNNEQIRYLGEVPNETLPTLYAEADLMLFASSCENLPNILIEAMSCGIPICCSDRSPMPEIGRDACLYFDPSDAKSIARCVEQALADPAAMAARAERGLRYAQEYSWARTAQRTFEFLGRVASTAKTKA